ncbi:aminotransferase class I/II-fold pyridoxal phosphate-dependent enzyme [Rothia sp. CCM 9416]|uniref:aminotransferase class I/II-fold pyridoxal phosphate-dependent enzyme n=1 Tax=Rothia sp. CCM 9416 TaxID=3402655 RepID=UPI003AE6294A
MATGYRRLVEQAQRVRLARGVERQAAVLGPVACDLATNDYLGLRYHPRLIQAGHRALSDYGASASSSRVVSGTLPVHRELEEALADLLGAEAALVFASGYAANLGLLAALSRPNTLLVMDEHVHASLHDAARLGQGQVRFFEHNNLVQAEQILAASSHAVKLLVVEGIYSVLGDSADLVACSELALRYDALLVVDEAHSIGVRGAGRGLVAEFGLAGSEHIAVTLSFGKALASQGGAVLASAGIRDYLVNSARSFIFDTALSPVNAATALESVRLIREEGQPLSAEVLVCAQLISGQLGLEPAAGAVQSLPIRQGSGCARQIQERLASRGLAVGCFRPPAVPDGIARLRLTAQAGLDSQVLQRALDLVGEEVAL